MLLLTKTDLKYTLRQLFKKPGFALLSTLVLAGGLGISLIMATLSYTLMYKTIPIENGDRIRHVCYADSGLGCRSFEAFDFSQLRTELTTVENIGIYQNRRVVLQLDEDIITLNALSTEWTIFQLSNTQPTIGRTLLDFDHDPGSEPVAVIGYGLWQSQFNGDAEIVDTLITIQGTATRIVGVMPAGYAFPYNAQLWLPISENLISPLQKGTSTVDTFALLAEGVSQREASEEVAQRMQRIRELHPPLEGRSYRSEFFRRLEASSTGHVRTIPMASLGGLETMVLLGFLNFISFCIFLLAAINVGTLLLARTNERIKDISIRVALGAPRRRLLAQTMSEGLMISLIGGAIALLFAGAFLEFINYAAGNFNIVTNGELLAFWMEFSIDRSTIVAVTLFLTLTILFTSVIPCLRIINGDFNSIMRDGTRGALGLRAGKFSRGLVLTSITLIVFLAYLSAITVSQVLPIRSILSDVETNNILSAAVTLDNQRYDAQAKQSFYRQLLSSLDQDPSIASTTIDASWSFNGIVQKLDSGATSEDDIGDSEIPANAMRASAYGTLNSQLMRPAGFSGVQLLEGRHLTAQDRYNGSRVALVSQSVAESLWPGESPVGKSFSYSNGQDEEDGIVWQIVGIISETVNPANPFSTSNPMIIAPISQINIQRVGIQVALANQSGFESLDAASDAMARSILRLDPQLSFLVENSRQVQRSIIQAINLGIAIGIGSLIFALSIALTGIYGLTQNSVQMMTQEIGTRRALGATDSMVKKLLLKRGSKQLLVGFLLAMVFAAPITYGVLFFIRNEVLGPVFLQVGFTMTLLIAVVFLAIYSPVSKVLRQEPADSLRYE